MPNELTRAFAALSRDAEQARLAPAAAVRRRADRRLAVQSLAGVVAVGVLVAGVTTGVRASLGDPSRPVAPPLAPSVSVSPAPSASSSPSSSAPPSSTPHSVPAVPDTPDIPDSIPARAFLRAADGNGTIVQGPQRESRSRPSPELCRATWPSDDRIGIRGTSSMIYRDPGVDPAPTPSGAVHDTVTVYRGSGASDFLRELRAAVRDCPEDGGQRYRARGSIGVGDESLLVERSAPARGDAGDLEPDGSRTYAYLIAVRVGNAVALVENDGWESISAERDVAVRFGRAAGERLADWRS